MATEEPFADVVRRAWSGGLSFGELIDFANRLEASGASQLAAVLYQTWLDRTESPYAHAALFNLGVALANAGDFRRSEAAYLRAIQIFPGFVQPYLNLGTLYERMGQLEEALKQWRWVVENVTATDQNRTFVLMALNHLGRVLENNKRLEEATGYLTRSLTIDPSQTDAMHHWVHLRQKQCIWPVYAGLPGVDPEWMRQCTSALAMLSVSDDPAQQLRAAHHFVEKKVAHGLPVITPEQAYKHRKIRVAYVSSDFSLHPVSMLMAELFELHDRKNFEVYGYCWSPEDGSALRQRVIAAMDHFTRIDQLSDEAAAQLMRSHEIDILVDLQGQTSGARANMLAYRPAPIQITYLGLPATTGLPSIDYVIADRFLIPEETAQFYSEIPLYMPDVYQVSDRKRPVAVTPSRASCGLPDDAFVFCSLNNNYKYTQEMFDVWMNILRRVPNSVLWLLSDNPWAEANLRKEALQRGIDGDRLLFAPRVLPEHYLARYACADLFLDTFPFNAGTTANDALWMGLPVLTLCGKSFAARMAGALLTAADMEELITYNLQDYEEKAVAIAHSPDDQRRLQQQLKQVHMDGVLFDTPRFVRNLEQSFKQLVSEL
ncbi:MAG: tetratricopeptide repeat protein [Rhodoferax sp.]|nr:tetratricopeptide repeat protein [Rhodoferax sp.]